MNINEIIVGHRVLVQSDPVTREVAVVKDIDEDTDLIVVQLSNGQIGDIKPEYIIKSFGYK